MVEEQKIQEDTIEIDLSQLFKLFKKNIRLIIISMVMIAAIACTFTIFLIDKKYASESTVYLTPRITETGSTDYQSINTNNILVNDYIAIMQGDAVLSSVAEKLDMKTAEVKGSISVTKDNDTRIIRVRATTKDPELSKQIVEETINTFSTDMKEVLNLSNITIIDQAQVNATPVSPNVKKNTLIGALLGALLSGGYIFLKFIFDKRLRNRTEAENFLGIPVLAEIPWFEE